MSRARTYSSQGGPPRGHYRSSFGNNHHSTITNTTTTNNSHPNNNHMGNYREDHYDFSRKPWGGHNYPLYHVKTEVEPSLKRRKFSASTWESSGRNYIEPRTYENVLSTCSNSSYLPASVRADANDYTSTTCKRDRSKFEDEEVIFMSRDEIERCSPSRKDGINALHETHLRYTYCSFLQNLGVRLELPQTTIGTAMVLCHRFFVRRSHACHDRFLIATAALFLAAKSEETPCPLNNVLRASSELYHKQDLSILSYLLPVDWFEQYRERVIEAEQMLLTTLNFELNVQHPYAPLTSTLNKLGLSQSILVNLALSLVSEGVFRGLACSHCMIFLAGGLICCSSKKLYLSSEVELPMCCGCLFYEYTLINVINGYSQTLQIQLRSSLWLQFKPHQIAAGATYLAARSLNMDLTSYQNLWQEFQTPPSVLKDVVQQLMELF